MSGAENLARLKVEQATPAARERRCRVCLCTDRDACAWRGVPCHWAGPEICSVCAALPPIVREALLIVLRADRAVVESASWVLDLALLRSAVEP